MNSILLHVYEDTGFDGRFRAACDLARATGGHITCLHATPFEDYLAVDPLIVSILPEEFSAKMRRHRLELQERIEARLNREGVSWDWLHADARMADALIRYAPLTDIVILSQAGISVARDEPRPLAADVAIGARTPVLAVPETLDLFEPASPALVAWNGTAPCANALRWALPLLRLAEQVKVLTVSERLMNYPPDAAARYLARHGIEAELIQRPPEDDVGKTIIAAGREIGAGLLVMGAYGHSRLRELILGGVTRSLVQAAPLPLFLAH